MAATWGSRVLLAALLVLGSGAVAACGSMTDLTDCAPVPLSDGIPAPGATSWDELPEGGPAPVDAVGADNVIRAADGRDVAIPLPVGVRIWQLRRVHGGWIIAYDDGIRHFSLVTDDGHLRPIEEPNGHNLLGLHPDGTQIAMSTQDERRVDVLRLPTFESVASIPLGQGLSGGHVNAAHFVGDDRILIQTSRLGDSSAPPSTVVGANWLTNSSIALENDVVVNTVDTMAILRSAGDGGHQLVRVEADLTLARLGCLPAGAWRSSPDRTRLATLCPQGTCVATLSIDDLPPGSVAVRTLAIPVRGSQLDWAENGDLLVSVLLNDTYGQWEWGLVRCAGATDTCTRERLRTGPTATAIDVGGLRL